MKGPERLDTSRLLLRRPTLADADRVFARYASNPEVTRYLSWPTHASLEQTRAFLRFSEAEWKRWPAGPYLIESRSAMELLGSTGLSFESPVVAATGYVLARDAWGLGYASEALRAIVELACQLGVRRLYALCHPGHVRSVHVLEKCGFLCEGLLQGHAQFPNLQSGQLHDCLCYTQTLEPYSPPQ
jgi:RimJ/RimL family protein N-acetyltransferase